jgi:predicted metal-dependent phosphoesterase TrpH
MKVELHAHTVRYSQCATLTASELMMSLVEQGYDAVYITEHDAVWPEQDLAYLRRKFPWMRIFGGVERTVEACHILVLGTSDEAYLKISDARVLLDTARQQGHLTVLAHPFRWPGADKILWDGLRPEAMEWRTPNHNEEAGQESRKYSASFRIPLVNSGDVHAAAMIGKFWIETNHDLDAPDDIRPIVLGGAYYNRTKT